MTEYEYLPTTATWSILATNIGAASEKLAKINARAAKLGGPAATITFGEPYEVVETDDFGFTHRFNMVEATVDGHEARVAGWSFVASIDHGVKTGATENVVSLFPGYRDDEQMKLDGGFLAVPFAYRSAPANCDHCGLDRNRHITLLLVNADGEFRQIGKGCAAEYLGIDPTNALRLAAGRQDLAEEMDDFGRLGSFEPSVHEFVAIATECVRDHGFTRTSDDLTGMPTRDEVFAIFREPKKITSYFNAVSLGMRRPMGDWSAKYGSNAAFQGVDFDLDRGREAATAMIAWAVEQTGPSDYILNLRAAAGAQGVGRNGGLLASLPTAYARAMGYLAERAAERAAEAAGRAGSVHVGEIGSKVELTGAVTFAMTFDGQYGSSRRVTVMGDDGNVYTTKGTADAVWGLEAGDRVIWAAKVKAHVEWKGTAQNELTAVKDATPVECCECGRSVPKTSTNEWRDRQTDELRNACRAAKACEKARGKQVVAPM